MEHRECTIEEVMDFRRQTVEESLHTISVTELNALTEEFLPGKDHPWFAKFLETVSDAAIQTLHRAMADDRVHILYSHAVETGVWFIPRSGNGPLEPGHLKFMKDLVESRRQPRRHFPG